MFTFPEFVFLVIVLLVLPVSAAIMLVNWARKKSGYEDALRELKA